MKTLPFFGFINDVIFVKFIIIIIIIIIIIFLIIIFNWIVPTKNILFNLLWESAEEYSGFGL
jgi:hypothetical protein